MPIDLNKPLGAASTPVAATVPSKKSINLLVHDRKHRDIWKYVLVALLLALLVGAFTKFAVLDVFKQLDLKQSELYAAQQELAAAQAQLDNYDAVLEEYRSYTGATADGGIDALQVMDMVHKVIEPRATVTAVSTSDGMLIVNVKDVTLDTLGKLADTLRDEALVDTVSVTTATEASTGDKKVAATLSITLVTPEEEGGKQ